MAASFPISLHVGARVVFRMLAPIRKPSPREKECPSSMRLSWIAEWDSLPKRESCTKIIMAFTMPIKITIMARSWHIETMPLLMDKTISRMIHTFLH